MKSFRDAPKIINLGKNMFIPSHIIALEIFIRINLQLYTIKSQLHFHSCLK